MFKEEKERTKTARIKLADEISFKKKRIKILETPQIIAVFSYIM